MKSRTFSIIKPDAVAAGDVGRIIAHIEAAGFRVLAMKMVFLSRWDAERFYVVHRERVFYDKLCLFMSSGPVVVMVLEMDGDAVTEFRSLIGATDPAQAAAGSIRQMYAHSRTRNAVHGSDSEQSAQWESDFFFEQSEVLDTQYRLPVSEQEIDS